MSGIFAKWVLLALTVGLFVPLHGSISTETFGTNQSVALVSPLAGALNDPPSSPVPRGGSAALDKDVAMKHEATEGRSFNFNDLIHDLAWPLTAMGLACIFRNVVPDFFSRIAKLKYGDVEAEFVGREANETIAKAVHSGYLGALNIDAIFESIKFNEWATLTVSRMLMRKGLVEKAHKKGA